MMSDTPLKDQALDIEIKRLLDLGAVPSDIYASVGRCSDGCVATEDQLAKARRVYHTVDCAIDDGAWSSPPPDSSGCWVAAWVWLYEGDDE